MNIDVIWTLISLVLTLFIFSYLFGDNPVFRIATGIFVGAAAGYFAVVIIYQVILPHLVVPLIQGSILALFPLILSGLLLTKLSPRLGRLGNVSMAVLVGSGAAIAIGGAALGTIFGQVRAAIDAFGSQANTSGTSPLLLGVEGLFLLAGTVTALAYFNFGGKEQAGQAPARVAISAWLSGIGKFFIALTFGAIFAGVLTAGLTALVERADFVIRTISTLITG